MICQRCSTGIRSFLNATNTISRSQQVVKGAATKRTFSSLPSLRPTLLPSTFRTSAVSFQPTPAAATTDELETTLDRWPKISSHPGLATTQVRYAPRNTFSPSHFVRKRRHGFLSRVKTRKGRATIQRRRAKRRSTLSH